MIVNCTNCGSPVEMDDAPSRDPRIAQRNDGWLCLWCPSMVCVDCYIPHTSEKHPNAGAHKKKHKK